MFDGPNTPRGYLAAGAPLVWGCRRFGCGHEAPADIGALIRRGYGDWNVIDLARKLRCTKCGKQDCRQVLE